MSLDTNIHAKRKPNLIQCRAVKKRVHESANTEPHRGPGSFGLARATRRFVGKKYTSQKKRIWYVDAGFAQLWKLQRNSVAYRHLRIWRGGIRWFSNFWGATKMYPVYGTLDMRTSNVVHHSSKRIEEKKMNVIKARVHSARLAKCRDNYKLVESRIPAPTIRKNNGVAFRVSIFDSVVCSVTTKNGHRFNLYLICCLISVHNASSLIKNIWNFVRFFKRCWYRTA